jgi:hypothetical protein
VIIGSYHWTTLLDGVPQSAYVMSLILQLTSQAAPGGQRQELRITSA